MGKAGRGRPTSFQAEFIEQAEKLCALGATDLEIADFFDITVTTLNRWKSSYPDFCAAIKNAKEIADERVERSLYHRAIGYTFPAEKISVNSQGNVTRVPYREHVPPDTTAAIFWLKNRRKAEWRDRHEVEVGQPGDFDRMTPDEIRAWIAEKQRELLDGGTTH